MNQYYSALAKLYLALTLTILPGTTSFLNQFEVKEPNDSGPRFENAQAPPTHFRSHLSLKNGNFDQDDTYRKDELPESAYPQTQVRFLRKKR